VPGLEGLLSGKNGGKASFTWGERKNPEKNKKKKKKTTGGYRTKGRRVSVETSPSLNGGTNGPKRMPSAREK